MTNYAARLILLLFPLCAFADPASDAKLQQELREIRQELNALKARTGNAPAPSKGTLKTEDLGGKQVSVQSLKPSTATGGLASGNMDQAIPPEMMKQLQESLGKMQKGQAEQDAFIKELDKDIK